MPGPQPPVARIRHHLRTFLTQRMDTEDLRPGDLLVVACSGGPDSLALAAATAFVAPRMNLRAGAIVVDHGIQTSSAAIAETARHACTQLGLDPVQITQVSVNGAAGGPEASARSARYAALEKARQITGGTAILLGHTRDDQAETVLLSLARGSGARSLAGMAAVRDSLWRPLLGASRADTHATCVALNLPVWYDPSNAVDGPWRTAAGEPLRRSAVRHLALPALAQALGQEVRESLTRTAELARADADFLDELTEQHYQRVVRAEPGEVSAPVAELNALPTAVRRRLVRRLALAAGCSGGTLGYVHIERVDALVRDWRGQGAVDLPGGVSATRTCGRLVLCTPTTQRTLKES